MRWYEPNPAQRALLTRPSCRRVTPHPLLDKSAPPKEGRTTAPTICSSEPTLLRSNQRALLRRGQTLTAGLPSASSAGAVNTVMSKWSLSSRTSVGALQVTIEPLNVWTCGSPKICDDGRLAEGALVLVVGRKDSMS